MNTSTAFEGKWVSSTDIIDLVKRSNPEKPLFLVKMRPLNDYGLFCCTDSHDPEYWVPCKVDENKYPLADNYKIELRSVVPGFGSDQLYLLDMTTLMRAGHIKVLDQAKGVPAPERVKKPVTQIVPQSFIEKLQSFSMQLLSNFR